MDGIGKLLAMPYGCGEQNMLKFAPNIYIMDYLTATKQLTPVLERSAKEYMRSGINCNNPASSSSFCKYKLIGSKNIID